MTDVELMEHKLYRTEHLEFCPVYGRILFHDTPCDCPKITQKKYIKRLELKIGLMRYFVPTDKEYEITDKVIKATKAV